MKVERCPDGVKVIVPTDRYGEADEIHVKVTDEGIIVDAISEGEVLETASSMWEDLLDDGG
jgi:hypothetical protein